MATFKDPAFPNPEVPGHWLGAEGMTIRQYAAIHLAAGLMGHPNWEHLPEDRISRAALSQADDLLAREAEG